MVEYYDEIFKRKSFHLFRGVGKEELTDGDLKDIYEAYEGFDKLYEDIRTGIRIIPSVKKDAQYCILIYSEKKDNYLTNVGYIGQQLDLWLVKHNIASLWYGIGKPDEETYDDMDFVIMFAIRKVSDESKYRKDMFKAKRKSLDEVWKGDDLGVANIARFSPSACNSQPWYVENSDGKLTVYRYRSGKRGIMPAGAVPFYNRIDMGIYLCILEICLKKQGIGFERQLFVDQGTDDEYTKVAVYNM
ncbi:MAG: nitroreductase [Clostridia bacterium]|nr:nitroreductase [Clostridia bacterium]